MGKKQIISNHRINQIITYYNPLTIQSCDYTPAHTIIQRSEDDARILNNMTNIGIIVLEFGLGSIIQEKHGKLMIIDVKSKGC